MWLIALLSLMSIAVAAYCEFSVSPESEHDRCLKNIGKLEMELFPDLPKEPRWAKWPGKTGWGDEVQKVIQEVFVH